MHIFFGYKSQELKKTNNRYTAQMAQYFFNKYENEGVPKTEEKPLFKIIAAPRDLLNLDTSIDMISDSKLKEYALEHPEENMVQLFSKFNYPIPKNKEEFDDPKFNASFLFKKDDKGNIIPRENIYFAKKIDKNYQNPLYSFYSLLSDSKIYQRNTRRVCSIEKSFRKKQKPVAIFARGIMKYRL